MIFLRSFAKGVLTLLTVFVLILAAGLWRMTQEPLRLPMHFSAVKRHIKSYGLAFDNIYLFCPSFYSLPQLSIERAHMEKDQWDLKTEKVILAWRLKNLFLGHPFKIAFIHMKEPILSFKQSGDHPPSAPSFDLKEALPTLFIKRGQVLNTPSGTPLPPNEIYGSLSLKKKGLQIRYHLSTPSLRSKAQGHILLKGTTLSGHLHLEKVRLKDWSPFASPDAHPYFEFFKNPMDLNATFKGTLVGQNCQGDLTIALNAPYETQSDLAHTPLHIKGTLEGPLANPTLNLKTTLAPFPWSGLPSLWPASLSPSAHHWCTQRIKGGRSHPATLSTTLSLNPFKMEHLEGTVGVEGAQVTYMDGLPAVEKVEAHATFNADSFTISLKKGHTEDILLKGGTVTLGHLNTDTPEGTIDLNLEGPLSRALWIAEHPPLSFAKTYGFSPEQVAGTSTIRLLLTMPLYGNTSRAQITPRVDASLEDFSMKRTVAGKDLDISKGTLNLLITKKDLSLKGDVHLNNRPSHVLWEEDLSGTQDIRQHYEVKTLSSIKEILSFTPLSFQEHVKNTREINLQGPVELHLDYEEKKEGRNLILNLGLKRTLLKIPLLNYKKPPDIPGYAFLNLHFKGGTLKAITPLRLSSKNLDLQGQLTFQKDGALQQAKIDTLKVNRSELSGNLEKKKGIWHLHLKGSNCMLPPLITFYRNKKDSNGGALPFTLSFNVDKVSLDHDLFLPHVSGLLKWDQAGFKSYDIRSLSDKEELLLLTYGQKASQHQFALKTQRLGEILRGLSLTNALKAEEIEIQATRPSSKAPFKGSIHARNLRIKGTPFMTKLLSLASLEGLMSTLTGEGILFVLGEAEFEYKDQNTAIQHLELTSSSLGVTAKGYVDMKKDNLDISGYVIPANILNKIIGNIPLIGHILSGGSKEHKGLISVSYTMKGPLKDPETTSNPLSILAPNLIKGLFSSLSKENSKQPTLQEGTPHGQVHPVAPKQS